MSTSDTVAEIRQGVDRLASLMRSARPVNGISLGKVGVLNRLNQFGPMYADELATRINQPSRIIARIFAALEADGLIMDFPDESERASLMGITPAGREVLGREMETRDDWLASVLAELSETEQEVLRIAGRLMSRLGDEL